MYLVKENELWRSEKRALVNHQKRREGRDAYCEIQYLSVSYFIVYMYVHCTSTYLLSLLAMASCTKQDTRKFEVEIIREAIACVYLCTRTCVRGKIS